MKSMKMLVVLALAAMCGSQLWAGDLSVFGAYWNTKDLDEGIGGGIRWGNQLGQSNFDFDSRVTYFPDIQGDPGPSDFDFSVLPVEIGVSYNFTENSPNIYLGAGVGWYFLNSDNGRVDDELGWYGVFGFEFGQDDGAAFFAEALYRQMEGTVKGVRAPGGATVQDVDINLNGLGANLGFMWSW